LSEPPTPTDLQNALPRILAAHRAQRPPAPDHAPGLGRAWGRALRHAATPFDGLNLHPGAVTVRLEEALEGVLGALPDHGIVAVLEDDAGRRGLIGLSHGAMDALIEVQTTGHVEASQLPPRRVTRIDEALSRDFLDLALAAFMRESGAIEGRDWPERMAYGSRIEDRDRLTLLLPERDYHILSAEVALGPDGGRAGKVVLILPADPDIGRAAPGAGATGPAPLPPGWAEGLSAALADAPLPLEAVLMRLVRPLGEVEALRDGDVLQFDRADLSAVTLETPEGAVILRGALGQLGGRRALRVTEATSGAQAVARPPAPPPPPEARAPTPDLPDLPEASAPPAVPGG
jgi:flagellar motor switch protein FliM